MLGSVCGIDPGGNGGIAVLNADGSVLKLIKMPPTPKDLLDVLESISPDCKRCYLEKVGGMTGQSASASFTFGKGYGHIEMALLACGIPTTTVTPQKWQKHYQLGKSAGHSKTEWKNTLKAKAQQLFPKEKVTLWAADALLIAKYGFDKEK